VYGGVVVASPCMIVLWGGGALTLEKGVEEEGVEEEGVVSSIAREEGVVKEGVME